MESRNPIFNRSEEFKRGGYASFNTPTPSAADLDSMYAAPSATSVDTGRMTLDDVVMRSAILFAVVLATALPTYFVWKPQSFLVVIGAGLVALALSFFATSRKGAVRVPVMLTYAAFEGVFVGGVSFWYSYIQNGIVPQAIFGTLAAFAGMLLVYKTGLVRNSPKFTKIMVITGAGYLMFQLVSLAVYAFTGSSVYSGGGILAIAVSLFGVVLAAFFLVLDFDYIEQGVRNGVPEKFAWVAAFGLVTTLIWLYLEILRLLSILNRN